MVTNYLTLYVAHCLNVYIDTCGLTFFGKSIFDMTDNQIISLADAIQNGFTSAE